MLHIFLLVILPLPDRQVGLGLTLCVSHGHGVAQIRVFEGDTESSGWSGGEEEWSSGG